MNNTNTKARSGAVLICVLACLCVVIAMVMSTLQSSLRGRKEVRQQRQLLQTELLCQAGVQRAVRQMAMSAKYQGETWTPKLEIPSFEFVVVEIRTEDSVESPKSIRVEVVATAPTGVKAG